jgi:hypothetical protein
VAPIPGNYGFRVLTFSDVSPYPAWSTTATSAPIEEDVFLMSIPPD